MSAFDHPVPNFSDQQMADILQNHYGLSGELKALDSERDQNARVSATDGRYVLKIANAGEDRDFIELQNATLKHLAEVDPDLEIPHLLPTRDGLDIADVHAETGHHAVRLLTYLDGQPLAEAGFSYPDRLENLGRFMGRVTKALQSFSHPASDRGDFLWALDNAMACKAYLGDIADTNNRARVESFFDRYEARALPRLPQLRKSVLHQDANDYNLLVDPDDSAHLSGLIDFGDMCLGSQINELAVTLAYALMQSENPLADAGWIIRGYADAMPLQADELDMLYDLVAMRLVMSVCISSHRSKDNPDNPYLLVSQAGAFDLLAKWDVLDTAYTHQLFRDAASLPAGALHVPSGRSVDELLNRRRRTLNPALSVSYRNSLKIVRGRGAGLYDDQGRRFLDCVNNISHVGHCHPHVAGALSRQAHLLNTNSRYLHDNIVKLAERIAATLPGDLSVVTFVNSGSEANELALRMARTATGRRETIVLDWAYHGNAGSTVEISPYKFKRNGGFPKPDFVEIAEFPDPYRGRHRGMNVGSGQAYAASVADCVARIESRIGAGPACFIAESVSGVGGQVFYPEGYFESAFKSVRDAGGLCIADEVQCGFGRIGDHFWAFESQGVVPDIVVLGKPIGGGHPLAAVVTTPEIAAGFDNGMEYFNSFGGNPVSMAVGLAVLDVIAQEDLMQNAVQVGDYLLQRFRDMADRYLLIGDVRGRGFFLGIELVTDRETRAPASEAAGRIVNHLRENGILLSTDGPSDNVLKFKPPMVFSRRDADQFCDCLEAAFLTI